MKTKKYLRVLLIFAMLTSCLSLTTSATEAQVAVDAPAAIQRATGRINTTVLAGKTKKMGTSLTFEPGEVVTFNASYSPSSASVDFGLIDSNDVFHFINVTSGSINSGIEIEEHGQYTLAIRNNSSNQVDVSGYVEY